MTDRAGLKRLIQSPELSASDVHSLLLACSTSTLHGPALAVLARHLLPRPPVPLAKLVRTQLESWLDGTDVVEHSHAFAALAALFQVDHAFATEFCKHEGFIARLAEAVALLDALPKGEATKERRTTQLAEARQQLATLLSIAASYAGMHPMLSELKAVEWTRARTGDAAEAEATRTAAAVAVLKLAKVDRPALDYLITRCLASDASAVEGLAVAAIRLAAKEKLAANEELLKRLCSLASNSTVDEDGVSQHSDVEYSVAALFAYLTAYPALLSEEQQAQERLRALSLKAEGGGSDPSEAEKEPTEAIDRRNEAVLIAGGAATLVRLLKTSSSATVRFTSSRALLSLAESSSRRGRLLQAGAARALLTQGSSTSKSELDLAACQALSKLLITSHPLLALNNSVPLLLDALHVLSRILHHPEATALQHFEALMALTNIASLAPELADRLAALPRVLEDVESFMLEAYPALRRRAATELACNLAGSSAARERWKDVRSATLFLALAKMGVDEDSEEEELPTARAAAGALARLADVLAPVIVVDDKLCRMAVELVVGEGTDDQLVWRAVVLLGEMVTQDHTQAKVKGIEKALRAIASDTKRMTEAREAAKEALKVYIAQ